MAALQVAAGMTLGAGPLYYCGVAGSAAHAAWQIADVKLDLPADCLAKFKSNFYMGGIFMLAAMCDRLAGGMDILPALAS